MNEVTGRDPIDSSCARLKGEGEAPSTVASGVNTESVEAANRGDEMQPPTREQILERGLNVVRNHLPQLTFAFQNPVAEIEWKENYDIWLHDFIRLILAYREPLTPSLPSQPKAAETGRFELHHGQMCVLCSGCEDDPEFDYCRACGFTKMRIRGDD